MARYLEIAGRRVFHFRLLVRLDHVLQRSAASTPRHVSNHVQSVRLGLDVSVCPVVGCVGFAHGHPRAAGRGAPGALECDVEALAVLIEDEVLHQDTRLAPPHQRSPPLLTAPLTPLHVAFCSISSDARTAGGLLTLLTSRSRWRQSDPDSHPAGSRREIHTFKRLWEPPPPRWIHPGHHPREATTQGW